MKLKIKIFISTLIISVFLLLALTGFVNEQAFYNEATPEQSRKHQMFAKPVKRDRTILTNADLFDDLERKPFKSRYEGLPLRTIQIDQTSEEGTNYDVSAQSAKEFHSRITNFHLYDLTENVAQQLVVDMQELPLIAVGQKSGGTQLKLIIRLADGSQALAKPMRFSREQETLPNHFYFTDFERHIAEIAAFHLDRRTPPVTGRLLNISSHIKPLVNDDVLLNTFFISPAGNHCFHGKCSYYCDTSHAICGSPELLEVSMATFLPFKNQAPRSSVKNPFKRSYHKRNKARWEKDPKFCVKHVLKLPQYQTGRVLLDLMDTSIFDFLQGNMDRHHWEIWTEFGNDSYPIILDNGRGFGRPNHDEVSILAPVYQCCRIRASTLRTLLSFHRRTYFISDFGSDDNERRGFSLSEAMRDSLATEPLAQQTRPILTEPHLLALDRRLALVLEEIRKCVNKKGFKGVVIEDGL